MTALLTGDGYQPRVVDDLDDIDVQLSISLEWALSEIKRTQSAARSETPMMKPEWHVLIGSEEGIKCLVGPGVGVTAGRAEDHKISHIDNSHPKILRGRGPLWSQTILWGVEGCSHPLQLPWLCKRVEGLAVWAAQPGQSFDRNLQ